MKKPKFENWPHWFRSFWPDEQARIEVMRGYTMLATSHRKTLADIALRNNVFAPVNEPNAHLAAIAEGRRQCALEIFKLANMDIGALFEMTRIDRTQGGKK